MHNKVKDAILNCKPKFTPARSYIHTFKDYGNNNYSEVFFCNLDLLLDNSRIDAYYNLKKKYEDAYLFVQVLTRRTPSILVYLNFPAKI